MSVELVHDWYVVRCFSSHENKVRDFLEREIEEQGLEDKVKEVLVPTETIVEIRGGKKKTREKNFFPGYILLNTHYDEEVNNLVQSAPSCLGFLKVGKTQTVPHPLKKHEVQRIIGRVREGGEENANIEIPFSEGDLVKVISGPFKDFDGTVQEVNTDKLKLRVMVSIFGRRTPVEVDVNQVESTT
ncbi:MAG: transcription termination/antitermination protein NusG [Balneola sp.]|jgi:transcriptional antiterminator NusG|uniref:transcription termination/antitermination protein NusG n=1 Tax=Balneola sp. EhC07 TaxID=1849360 RepID=UPI0007F4F661|nr:transcription termination/antitermination protein NusG [Balneola sp. EhC07]MAB66203.1 transcription termination/antitermination factor NusG [Bacteroidota bacterium]MAC06257.1 transcription termination/antitermination factor NusG [Balneola sp.]MBR9918831.1 transcription termination/antitermination factor NusG [bacterium]MAO78440.1 transcription termination/antitermination factor NusG [Balneola sp.]MBF63079.1 transcription termination/antitermination factor NusG [Balneola sp.]|tara:strand:+ start:121 stop:678 length:558 start_codon:yes stop_codon:yes gene_type:complete